VVEQITSCKLGIDTIQIGSILETMKANINTLKQYDWFKAMPKLMQDLFIDKYQYSQESVRFARMMAEDKYFDIMSNIQEYN